MIPWWGWLIIAVVTVVVVMWITVFIYAARKQNRMEEKFDREWNNFGSNFFRGDRR